MTWGLGYLHAWHLVSLPKDVGVDPIQRLLAPFVVHIKALQIFPSTKSPASQEEEIELCYMLWPVNKCSRPEWPCILSIVCKKLMMMFHDASAQATMFTRSNTSCHCETEMDFTAVTSFRSD